MRIVRKLHRGGALLVGVFVLMHLANHLAALGGIAAHLRFMEAARLVYRQPLVEGLLLLAVLALFTHLGCALARRAGTAALLVPVCAGVLVSSLVVAVLMGKLLPYEVPQTYGNTYVQS